MARKMFWTGILTFPFAIIQAIIACLILLLILVMAIGVGSYVSSFSDMLGQDHFTGMNIGSSITSHYALFVTIFVVIAASLVALSVSLCKGIWKNKAAPILVYVTCGGIVTIIRMSTLTKWNFINFPEDKTVLYLGFYTLYLILLVVHVVNIKHAREQEAIRDVPMAIPSHLVAPPALKDANQHLLSKL